MIYFKGERTLRWSGNWLTDNLGLLLHCAHSVHRDDMVRLASVQKRPTIPDSVKHEVHKYLAMPRTFMRISVNRLRKHYGNKIPDYVKQSKIPKRIVPFILIEDLLSILLKS